MNRTEKAKEVDALKEALSRAQSLLVADYRGLTVAQTNEMRSEFRKVGCNYQVVKNTLVKRAIAGTELERLSGLFKGPTAIAYSVDDAVAPAKVLDKFAKDFEKLEVRGGYLDGSLLDDQAVSQLAKMKGKDELRADLLRLFNAPATTFVRLLAAAPTKFVYLLRARERQL